MKRLLLLLVLLFAPVLAVAEPVSGIYNSTDIPGGGPLLPGRISTWRPGIDSGLPYVMHLQSYGDPGMQWEISCAKMTTNFLVEDKRVGGVGNVEYTSTFTGGTFAFFPGAWPWGDGTGTLSTTNIRTVVQYILVDSVSTPVESRVNGTTSGTFDNDCQLSFVIFHGIVVGETSSGSPSLKPPDYPVFWDGTCAPAAPSQQFGSWGTVTEITLGIDCPIPAAPSTWGTVKALYR